MPNEPNDAADALRSPSEAGAPDRNAGSAAPRSKAGRLVVLEVAPANPAEVMPEEEDTFTCEADAVRLLLGLWAGRALAGGLDDTRAENASADVLAMILVEINGDTKALEATADGRLLLPKSAFVFAASDAKLRGADLPNGTLLELLDSVGGGSAGTAHGRKNTKIESERKKAAQRANKTDKTNWHLINEKIKHRTS